MTYRLAAILIVETNDPRLSQQTVERLAEPGVTASMIADVRKALVQHLPKDIRRVVSVMSAENAEAMCVLYDLVGTALSGDPYSVRPPADYVPPAEESQP